MSKLSDDDLRHILSELMPDNEADVLGHVAWLQGWRDRWARVAFREATRYATARNRAASLEAELESTRPDRDATDGAHPCWWRGHDNGANGASARVASLEAEVRGKVVQMCRERVAYWATQSGPSATAHRAEAEYIADIIEGGTYASNVARPSAPTPDGTCATCHRCNRCGGLDGNHTLRDCASAPTSGQGAAATAEEAVYCERMTGTWCCPNVVGPCGGTRCTEHCGCALCNAPAAPAPAAQPATETRLSAFCGGPLRNGGACGFLRGHSPPCGGTTPRKEGP